MRFPSVSIRFDATRIMRAVILFFVSGAVLATAACSASAKKESSDKPTSITLATGFVVDSLDPIKNGFWGNEFGWSELLLRPAEGKAPEPWLLEKFENTDDKTWVLTLKNGTHFQNGAPLDGASLAAVMNFQLKERPTLKILEGTQVESMGDRQVKVVTAKPVPNMNYLLADESKFTIFDLKAYELAKGNPLKLVEAKLYTGPYVVEKMDAQHVAMVADKNYWGGKLPLESVTVKFIDDAQSRILAVQNGEVDLALYPPTSEARNLQGRTDSFWLKGTPVGPTFQLQMNQRGAFSDINIRKAVISSIDYKEIATDVMGGLYAVTNGMYSPEIPYYKAIYDTDISKVDGLLKASGYEKQDKNYTKNGEPLTLTIITYPQQPDSGTLGQAVQSQLAKVGITVNLQQVPDTTAVMKDPNQKWDGAIVGNGTTSFSGDPIMPLQNYFTSTGPRNYSGLNDPALDQMISDLSVSMDIEKREKILGDIQSRIGDQAYMGFLGMRYPGVVAGSKWKDYKIPPALLWVGYDTSLR